MLNAEEKEELLRLAGSSSLKKDMRYLSAHRHNPFTKDGEVDVDSFLEFVQQFNEFINHEPRQFKKIEDKDMKL